MLKFSDSLHWACYKFWWNISIIPVSGLEKLNHDLPDVSNVKSKLDDKNLDYKPPTSTKRIEVRKLNWRAESKIMNNNLDYKKKALQASMENGIDKAPKVRKNTNNLTQIFAVMTHNLLSGL